MIHPGLAAPGSDGRQRRVLEMGGSGEQQARGSERQRAAAPGAELRYRAVRHQWAASAGQQRVTQRWAAERRKQRRQAERKVARRLEPAGWARPQGSAPSTREEAARRGLQSHGASIPVGSRTVIHAPTLVLRPRGRVGARGARGWLAGLGWGGLGVVGWGGVVWAGVGWVGWAGMGWCRMVWCGG